MNNINKRQIVLDTETTGMNIIGMPYEGHCIIEIGAIEIIDRRITGNNFHVYLQPDRLIDPEAFIIHGISDEFLLDKPNFNEISNEFLKYIYGAELIIHNASFDIGFINYELSKLKSKIEKIENICKIIDSLSIARRIFPGKRNNLNALCTRYKIDNSKRTLHGALLDAEILAEIFLNMTGGQTTFLFSTKTNFLLYKNKNKEINCTNTNLSKLRVIKANKEEIDSHELYLNILLESSGNCLWKKC